MLHTKLRAQWITRTRFFSLFVIEKDEGCHDRSRCFRSLLRRLRSDAVRRIRGLQHDRLRLDNALCAVPGGPQACKLLSLLRHVLGDADLHWVDV